MPKAIFPSKASIFTTFLLGSIPPALYLYFFVLLGWDNPGRGPLRSSTITLPITLIPFVMVLVLPLATILFGIHQTKRQEKGSYIYIISFIIFQIIWGLWDFYIILNLTD